MPMFKVTYRQLLNDDTGLTSIMNRDDLPHKAYYAIAKNARLIAKELSEYNDERRKLAEKYANKNEKDEPVIKSDGTYDLSNENQHKFNDALSDLQDFETEINIFTFPISLLRESPQKPEGIHLKPVEFMAVDYMVDEDK
jgi:hypothetical protein